MICLAKYEEEKAARTALKEQLESAEGQGVKDGTDLVNSIPKPSGTAGKDYSIQIKMGLSGGVKKTEKYKAIQVCDVSDVWIYTDALRLVQCSRSLLKREDGLGGSLEADSAKGSSQSVQDCESLISGHGGNARTYFGPGTKANALLGALY